MESASVAAGPGEPTVEAGLKKNAISFVSNVVIGVASTAPGYSLAATLGLIAGVAGLGLQSPAIMIVSFLPMLCIAAAYYYMNRADPDCGTTFTWVTKAMGPRTGWFGGWGIIVADVLVMPSLAYVAGNYTFLLFGWDAAANDKWAILAVGVAWIVVMTAICYLGTELSARTQRVLLTIEVFTLVLFAVVALVKVYTQDPSGSSHPALSWFNPLEISSFSALTGGVLLGIFIYTPTTSSRPSARPCSGGALDKLLIISVLTSASASTQTTILPTARTSLSMARIGAIPRRFAHIHPRHLTPDVSTLWMGGVSALVLVVLTAGSENLVFDAFTALGLMIAFYYGITGFACAIYYRRELTKSFKNFFFIGGLPTVGGLVLAGVFGKSVYDLVTNTDSGYAKPLWGISAPFWIAVFALALGAVLLVLCMGRYRDFFRRKPEVAPPELVAGAPAGEGAT